MNLTKIQRQYVAVIEAEGASVIRCDYTGGNHLRCITRLPDGSELSIIGPSTPSDAKRNLNNFRTSVRRAIRNFKEKQQ